MPNPTCAKCARETNPALAARGRHAANKRHHPEADHSDTLRDLAAANLEQFVRKTIEKAPPLTNEQRDRITALLRAGNVA
jgi:hypothetical protein